MQDRTKSWHFSIISKLHRQSQSAADVLIKHTLRNAVAIVRLCRTADAAPTKNSPTLHVTKADMNINFGPSWRRNAVAWIKTCYFISQKYLGIHLM